ncbi:geranylgeranylglycerol-phosphate geranylgeranyltransferase [Lutimonas zeaxanthinifaciens]|uniref:geranylgeranylglycerol-phosphate geranylgeranyltransferase n=1 Tax=Lutimonas zeaxanthinifaciens TaxID=3060215 RepID=UPI00265CCE66|nr:geranylgeranylglycerol-phosphate geranylgeranyltransferase [Lutimonas sp. YSD2104]WKK66224.1 geranylgeranylglycerol-phosphate geranylgeranyltransferase [Lutimonas sp. YSD2104]
MDASGKGLDKKPKSKKSYSLFFKFLSLLSVVRGYNIALIVLAQYLAAIFIFSPDLPLKSIIFNLDLYFIVLATICVIASGYIINNFYDSKKDRINKPIKSKIDSIVSQKVKLQIYFFLNFIGVVFGLLVSWRAALFFAVYIFLIWLYSHKLKKYPLTGLFSASILSILPFFAIFIYYKNFSEVIFIHAAFLFFVLMIRELLKDLENIKGDIVQDYQTIPIKYGEYFTKALITLLVLLTMNPVYFLWGYPEIGMMKYYFYLVGIVFVFFLVFLWKANSKRDYIILHNVIKLVILIGVLSILLIDTSVIIKRIINV